MTRPPVTVYLALWTSGTAHLDSACTFLRGSRHVERVEANLPDPHERKWVYVPGCRIHHGWLRLCSRCGTAPP